MVFLVKNCFHWIGFHLVEHLLNAGENVIGVDHLSTDLKQHLSMFVGRHDRFQFGDGKEKAHFTVYIKQKGTLDIISKEKEQWSETVHLPLLIGPWMPMTECGMWRENGDWIAFTEDTFLNEAVCIEDYMNCLVHCIREGSFCELEARFWGNDLAKHDKLMDNDCIKTKLASIQDHYQQHKTFYQSKNSR